MYFCFNCIFHSAQFSVSCYLFWLGTNKYLVRVRKKKKRFVTSPYKKVPQGTFTHEDCFMEYVIIPSKHLDS